MVVKKSKGSITNPSKESELLTYLSRGKEIGVATLTVDGKAEKLQAETKQYLYVTKGRGVVNYAGKEKKLSKSYVLILDAGTQYAIEGKIEAVIFNA